MNTMHLLRILSVLVLMSSTSAYCQWKKSTALQGNIIKFAYNATTLFAQGSAVARSVNDGATWEKVNIEPKGSRVHDIALNNQVIIASTDEGIYKSSDNGSTWTSITNNLPLQPSKIVASRLVYLNNTIVACIISKGLYSSTNNGDMWQEVNNGFDISSFIYCTYGYGNTFYIGSGNGVYVSSNSGLSWIQSKEGFSSTDPLQKNIRAITSLQGNIVAATENGIFISSNNGTSWSPTKSKSPNQNVLCMATKDKSLFVGTESGIYVSSDNGTVWEQVDGEISFHPILSIIVKGDQIYTGTYAGGYYTRNVFDIVSDVSTDVPLLTTWCYPNPASDIITITTPPSLENNTDVIRYSVVNLQGEEITHMESYSKSISIPIHDFVSGVYTIVATCGMQRTTTMVSIVQ